MDVCCSKLDSRVNLTGVGMPPVELANFLGFPLFKDLESISTNDIICNPVSLISWSESKAVKDYEY